MQLPFLVLGLLIFGLIAPGMLPLTEAGILLLPLLLTAVLALLVRLGPGRAMALRLARRLGLQARVERDAREPGRRECRRGAHCWAAAWHFLAWSLGAAEVWVILAVLGVPAGPAQAYVIESLGMAARSLGFVLPAGLGAQEAGLAAVAVALGVPLEEAVAMSMLKRLREVLMNLPGLIAWRWSQRHPAAVSQARSGHPHALGGSWSRIRRSGAARRQGSGAWPGWAARTVTAVTPCPPTWPGRDPGRWASCGRSPVPAAAKSGAAPTTSTCAPTSAGGRRKCGTVSVTSVRVRAGEAKASAAPPVKRPCAATARTRAAPWPGRLACHRRLRPGAARHPRGADARKLPVWSTRP